MYKPDKAAVNIDVIAHSHCKIIKTHEKKEFFSSSSRHARCKVASMKPMVLWGIFLLPCMVQFYKALGISTFYSPLVA